MAIRIRSVDQLVDLVEAEPVEFRQHVIISQTIETKVGALLDIDDVLYSDLAKGATVFAHTLDGNKTLAKPENPQPGTTYVYVFTQDGTGGRTLAYNAVWKFPGGNTPTLSTAANAVDVFAGLCANSTTFHANLTKNFS